MIDSLVYYRLGQAESLMARASKIIEARVPSRPTERGPIVADLLNEMKKWDREVRTLIKESLLEESKG